MSNPSLEESEDITHSSEEIIISEPTSLAPAYRYRTHERHPPKILQEYVTYTARHPIANSITYHRMSPSHSAFLSTISNLFELQNFQEANLQDVWRKAMKEELQALDENQT
ncbi:hypothetical protein ACFX15_030743 [Malus domestica]